MTVPVMLTLRTRNNEAPHQVQGFSPLPTCALAVYPSFTHDSHIGWRPTGMWSICHRPTGFRLGSDGIGEWKTREAAEQVMGRCMPDFPAWLLASGNEGDIATTACKTVFQMASS